MLKKDGGSELWIVNNDKYCGKVLSFNAGKQFSVHYHVKKDEVFYVTKGVIKLHWMDIDEGVHAFRPTNMMLDDFEREANIETLQVGDAFHVPPLRVHYIYALEDSELHEFSTHHEDSDSYRLRRGD